MGEIHTIDGKIIPYEGKLFTFEGPEGGGKSTQINKLREYLTSLGFDVVNVREPGGTALAERIRSILINPTNSDEKFPDLTELLLMEAARSATIANFTRPHLEAGRAVIHDRDYHSTIAYQGASRGLPMELIHLLNKYATQGIVPDLTMILDIDPRIGLARARRKGADRIEAAGFEFHDKVRQAYLDMPKLLPHENIQILDASLDPDNVYEQIKYHVDELLKSSD